MEEVADTIIKRRNLTLEKNRMHPNLSGMRLQEGRIIIKGKVQLAGTLTVFYFKPFKITDVA